MVSSDFRKIAREKLAGKWGKAAVISLVWIAFYFVLGFVEGLLGISESGLASIINAVIEIPLTYGITIVFLKLFNSEETTPTDMFTLGYKNFKRSWGVYLQTLLKLLVPFIFLIVSLFLMGFGAGMAAAGSAYSYSGVAGAGSVIAAISIVLMIASSIWLTVKSYYYQIASFIAIENPDMPSKQVVEKSKELMTGNRWKFFCLQFSFIGWAILASFTFGIGYLWLLPYIMLAQIAFYKNLAGGPLNVEYSTENNPDSVSNTNTAAESASNIDPLQTEPVDNSFTSNDPLSTDSADSSTSVDSNNDNNEL